MRARKKPNIFK